jgi:hypothetical protein
LSLQASISSVRGPLKLYFEPLKLLNFDFNADPDATFYSNANPDPKIMQIHADPCGSGSATLLYVRYTTLVGDNFE